MNTTVSITAYGTPEKVDTAISSAFAAMKRVDELASFYRPDSEVSRWNREKVIRPSASFSALLQAASEGVMLSGGLCDPTFAVLHQAYGFYHKSGRQPTEVELKNCLSLIGWNKVISGSSGLLFLATDSIVDFGGVGGGYAVEEACRALRHASCTTFFIDEGGDLWMEGKKPDGTAWKVGIRDPRNNGILAFVETNEPLAISTSGDYENFVEAGGKKIGHIVDPFTGLPARYYQSVTVLASSPLKAEILTKKLFLSPPDQAREFSDANSIAALFLPASGPVWVTTAGENWFTGISR